MVPPPSSAPSTPKPSRTVPADSTPDTISGSASGKTPAPAASAGSQPTKSKSGYAVIAVVESMTPRPHSAWLATACAGQNDFAAVEFDECHDKNASSSPESPG